MNRKLIVGNWKMNPTSPREARSIFLKIRNKAKRFRKVRTVICPPSIYLENLEKIKSGVSLGGQDSFWEVSGAQTGVISPSMLKNSGAGYCILGHSEVRERGDTNKDVNKKVKLALDYRLVVILCVGEKERDAEGEYLNFLRDEINECLHKIPQKYFGNIVIAYEPIWAISGKAKHHASTPEDFREKAIFIKKILNHLVGKDIATKIPILYGGSANDKNALNFIKEGHADGLLVGGASLDPDIFNKILKDINYS